ncbi:hypothetical protein LSHI6S_00698 [Leifsonia shinshuensis]
MRDQQRLRHAYHAAALLRERYDPVTVRSWFKAMNPSLGDAAPAQVLREGEPSEVAREVLAAAKSFACIGWVPVSIEGEGSLAQKTLAS